MIGLSCLIATGVGSIVLWQMGTFNQLTVLLFMLGLWGYGGMLVAMSIMFTSVYIIGLSGARLVDILKGKLPLKRLLSIMLIGQLVSVLVVGWTANRLIDQYHDLQIKEQAAQEWDRHSDYVQLSYSYSAGLMSEEESQEQYKQWYDFSKMMLSDHNALAVNSNIERYTNLTPDKDEGQLSDYTPTANTLYVTPNYLTEQHIEVDQAFLDRMNHLRQGEFGLILPDILSGNASEYEQVYIDHMSIYASIDLYADHEKLFDFQADTTIVSSGRQRFLYNSGSRVNQQYLDDPIIVVVTPESMGDTPASHLFWGTNVGSALQLKGYDQTIEALKTADLYNLVSYVLNSRLDYYASLSESRTTFYFLMAGTLLGILTSILLFDTMNLLYFEQFRRDIFIKRLSGMNFREVHRFYNLAQIVMIIVSCVGLMFITQKVLISTIVALVFLTNAWLILYRQHLREHTIAVTVLKGK